MTTGTAERRKCVIWDLDETLWRGVCLEGEVTVRAEARDALTELDRRGVLHSIASRGVASVSSGVLRENGLDEYFLAPRINWLPKPTNIVSIARELDLPLDAMAFVDDDAFERAQVGAMLPDVLVIDAEDLAALAQRPEFDRRPDTAEARSRRLLYRAESERRASCSEYSDRASFLVACRMELATRHPLPPDAARVHELMSRTHQLNTTGLLLSREDVGRLIEGTERRELRVARLTDAFGPYGTIGVAIVEERGDVWGVDYLALSCRVLGRGIERAFLHALLDEGAGRGLAFGEVRFRDTGRNPAMRALLQMTGMRAALDPPDTSIVTYRRPLADLPPPPHWVSLT